MRKTVKCVFPQGLKEDFITERQHTPLPPPPDSAMRFGDMAWMGAESGGTGGGGEGVGGLGVDHNYITFI